MALEQLIVAWSKDRPAWQREVMRRVAVGDVLSDADYDQLVEDIVGAKEISEPSFGLEHLPQAAPQALPVRLVSIERPEHVNALESRDPLTFEPHGLTIVYGDNASGKSGYARLLKRISRARHQEDVLTDVFRDTSLAKPRAVLSVLIGHEEESLDWPESARPELRSMLFYDGSCGNAYIATESDFPYRPSALFVMDGLIEACVALRSRIDAKLVENGAAVNDIPVVPEEVQDTDAGRFLTRLCGSASVKALDALIQKFDESSETLHELKAQEVRLRSADTSKERQNLIRQSEKLEALRKHLERLRDVLGNEGLAPLQRHRDELRALEEAEAVLARAFESYPLPGVGSSPWKALWESARRFSEEHAYPGQAFPVVGEDRRCVLCQQTLEEEGGERLSRFDHFVKDDTQVRLREARRLYDSQVERLTSLAVSPEAVANSLKDLEVTHRDPVTEIRELLEGYEKAQEQTRKALASSARA